MKNIFEIFENLIKYRELNPIKMAKNTNIEVLCSLLNPFRFLILASILSAVILTVFDLAKLWAISYIVDLVAYSEGFSLTKDAVIFFGAIILCYAILDPLIWLINYMLRMQSLSAQSRAFAQWQSHISASRHDLEYFNSTHAGQVAARVGQVGLAVQSSAELLAGRFPMGFTRFFGSLVLMSYLVPVFSVPVLIWIILNGLFAIWLVPKFNAQAQKISKTSSVVNGSVSEYFSNIRAIKTSFAYDLENENVCAAIENQSRSHLEINRLTTLTGLAIRVLNTGLVVSVLALGVSGLNTQTITPGEFVAGVTLASSMALDAGWFVAMWEGLTQCLGAIKDARPTIDASPKIVSTGNDTKAFSSVPLIEFDNVSFSYDLQKPIIKQMSFVIKQGEKFGIVGPSGAGKSTLIDLLLRLYEVTSGDIKIDGQNIRDISLQRLRNSFAVVSQDDMLFHRSIEDNISFAVADFTSAEVRVAAKAADANSFIEDLESSEHKSGYNTVVGDRGAKLSGGQRQRILLARAFMQKRPILVLDEATSSLDSNSEGLIQNAIASYSKSTTIIAVAHRLATVKEFDTILVVEEGRIVGLGTHEHLLATNSLYGQLWDRQT